MSDSDIVRASVDAYQRQDVAAAERLFAPEFVFTSPQDDHISKAEYLERCFPTVDRFADSEVLQMVETSHGVLSLYEYELVDGGRYRNVELTRVRGDLIVETQVYLGGQVG